MKTIALPPGSGRFSRLAWMLTCALIAVGLGAVGYFASRLLVPRLGQDAASAAVERPESAEADDHAEQPAGLVILPKEQWETADLSIAPAEVGAFRESKWVTGKVIVNRDQAAEIYPLVEGQIHLTDVGFGERVEQGQVLAVIDSQQIGEAKLKLVQDRQASRFAEVAYDWADTINKNVQQLINALRQEPPLEQVQEQFDDQPIGEYRAQLMSAYASLYETRLAYERLQPLGERGSVAGKQVIEARAAYQAAQAGMKALLEQIGFTADQQALRAKQTLEQAELEVNVSRSKLFLLGYRQKDLENIDPIAEGEEIAHYEVRSPLSGTTIEKNVVVGERVSPETAMFEVADLASVWIQADIYQRDLPLLTDLGETLEFRSQPYDHTHQADIFYTGDILDPASRTIRLLAVAPNPDGHLKPGMFVQVRLPGPKGPDVLQVPLSAVQRHEEDEFVFVHLGGERFERRDVVVGARDANLGEFGAAVIRQGLKPGEPVAVQGGLALKANLLSDIVGGSHAH